MSVESDDPIEEACDAAMLAIVRKDKLYSEHVYIYIYIKYLRNSERYDKSDRLIYLQTTSLIQDVSHILLLVPVQVMVVESPSLELIYLLRHVAAVNAAIQEVLEHHQVLIYSFDAYRQN